MPISSIFSLLFLLRNFTLMCRGVNFFFVHPAWGLMQLMNMWLALFNIIWLCVSHFLFKWFFSHSFFCLFLKH